MASSFRRLAKDFAALQASLPPNYLFPESDDALSVPDDLTQLVVLVTGAEGTPYSQGLWRLHLKIPHDYPKSPPKATFKTRIYHPNVEETTGAVCLETLKRDWDPKLTLKDILVTISCLLIQPNPDSALNAAAGALIQEDYEAFSTQAKLMTRIHAPIPSHLTSAVQEAKRRGEEHDAEEERMKRSAEAADSGTEDRKMGQSSRKERGLLSKAGKGKRPLSDLSLPVDGDQYNGQDNAAPNNTEKACPIFLDDNTGQRPRKSPKTKRSDGPNTQNTTQFQVSSDEVGKENNTAPVKPAALSSAEAATSRPTALRKVSNVGARRKAQPRVGIRRL
ncbi:hypothetical protein ABEF95_012136 [Exophiala dermatitidis]